MPRFLIARRSGVHRVACLALYRALLMQSAQLDLPLQDQITLQHVIRAAFRKQIDECSPKKIVSALALGHEALHTLQNVPETGSAALGALCNHLQRMNLREDRSHVTSKELEPSPNRPRALPAKRPGTSPVLSRPFLNISGRRRVPKLVNAQGVPFLRIAKPQPPFLSRLILDKHTTRQKRFNLIDTISETKRIAEAEDEWDRLLALEYGVKDERRRSPPPSWVQAYQDAIHEVYDKIQEATNANASMARKMWAIVEQEKELAEKEKAERKRAKLVLKLQKKNESRI